MTEPVPDTPQSERIGQGHLALTLDWRRGLIRSIKLAWAGSADEPGQPKTPAGRELDHALAEYLDGKLEAWPNLPLDWSGLTPFSRLVLQTLTRVPSGQVISYGQLAALCARPKAARAVGRVMASNPWPLVVPCHRVIGSKGALTGFGPGLDMKRFLLDLEIRSQG